MTLSPQMDHDDEAFVFQDRVLRPGVVLEETARFGDDHWPLFPVAFQAQARAHTLHFHVMPTAYRLTAKRLCYSLLSGDLPPREPRVRADSVLSYFYNIRYFFSWLEAEHAGCRLAHVDENVLGQYSQYVSQRFRSTDRVQALLQSVTLLWRFRSCLPEDSLRIDPRRLNAWNSLPLVRSHENTTPRIPEEVHSRALVWALRFVDDFSVDILEGLNRLEELRRGNVVDGPLRRQVSAGATKRIRTFLRTAYAENRPLPSSCTAKGSVSMRGVSHLVPCAIKSLKPFEQEIRDAASELGVSDHTYLGLPMKATLDGLPWLEGISVHPSRDDSMTVLPQMLQAACYIVIAFLSGMRDSEIKHLRVGCSTIDRTNDGQAYRWKLTSKAFKGEDSAHGVNATWVVGEAAARAVKVLERLHETQGSADWLFAPIRTGPGAGSAGRAGNQALTTATSNRQINRFVTWVNNYCQERGRWDSIPDVDGKPWRLSTRQFRRTLAWYIARRPGGSIAGAIAYRHHSVQMFEGYAGNSDSGFRAEVEAEEALARGEHLLAMIDQHEHRELAGPAADEAERRLESMAGEPAFAGTVTTDRRRFLRILETNDPEIYPGHYVTCVYQPDKALCHSRIGSTSKQPELGDCKPLACKNVALSSGNLSAWHKEIEQIEEDLSARPKLPPLLEARLLQRLDQVSSFIDRHEASQ